jgi:hypothetical protein
MNDFLEEATEAIARLMFTPASQARAAAQALTAGQRRTIHEAAEAARATIRAVLEAPTVPTEN